MSEAGQSPDHFGQNHPADETIDASAMPHSAFAQVGGIPAAIDRFTILRQLGAGGMGDVFLARHPVTGTQIALKRLKPMLVRDAQAVHRFLIEARHMYHLNHPNILRIMEVLDPPAGPYYVMPYMPAGSLAGKLRPGQPADYVTTIRVARDVASALVYAHGKGIIHRDLKPGNVLLDADGRGYLADFGLVRTLFNDSNTDITQSQTMGTAPYMSPAVARGEAEDTRCDIYSFGAMLYELLTGHPPYQGHSGHEIIGKVMAGPPKPIPKHNPHAPGGLVKIAEGCMARELRDRYARMDDVLGDIDRVEKGKVPLGPRGKEGKGVSKTAMLAAAVIVIACALGAVGAWMKYGKKTEVAVAPQSKPGNDRTAVTQPAIPVVAVPPEVPAQVKPSAAKAITNSIDMEFVRIEPGRFTMGSPETEEGRQENEKQHTRIIGHAFYMGTTTVTQKQWKAVMGNDNNPTRFKGDDLPVETVSWNDAMEFVGKLNGLEKATGRHYRLPSEGEWEYACRAGTTTPFSFGTTIDADQANYKATETYGAGQKGEYRDKTVPAKSFQPNPWGLYQMHGNVSQWCATDWNEEYGDGEITDPQEKEHNNATAARVLRGGSWFNSPRHCRSATRDGLAPDRWNDRFGFRVVLDFP